MFGEGKRADGLPIGKRHPWLTMEKEEILMMTTPQIRGSKAKAAAPLAN